MLSFKIKKESILVLSLAIVLLLSYGSNAYGGSTLNTDGASILDQARVLEETEKKILLKRLDPLYQDFNILVWLVTENVKMDYEGQFGEFLYHQWIDGLSIDAKGNQSDAFDSGVILIGLNMDNFEAVVLTYNEKQFDGMFGYEWLEEITKKAANNHRIKPYAFFNSLAELLGPNLIPFVDVPLDAWYYDDVARAWHNQLINGKSETSFAPDMNLTYAEALKLAACIHQLDLGLDGQINLEPGQDRWYTTYLTYAAEAGIIEGYDFGSYEAMDMFANSPISRGEFMGIFANALPNDKLKPINIIADDSIPDLKLAQDFPDRVYEGVYKLYKAGVVKGSDSKFSCQPNDNIKRSEVAAILTRMVFPENRLHFEINP
ncbi:MAG: S-layer homology domain-containing protein [Syntrophomonadaceae bacterium]|nr:S-layer homology domain-containing protein [Syntrophomonadaceae bacterium]